LSEPLQGIVSGRIVQLVTDPGLLPGQCVEVVLRPLTEATESTQSAAGMLANDPSLEDSLQEIEQTRKAARLRAEPK